MAVEAAKVKELRDKTGLPMMDCKRALEKAGGDVETAYDELRKGGLKAQEKLAGRTANQGRIGSYVSPDGKLGVLVALRCETEPVGNNENFQALLKELVDVVAKKAPADKAALEAIKLASGQTVADSVTELVNKIRENISLGGFARFEGESIVQYVHFDNKKAAMVALKGAPASDEKVIEVGKELGMHIVFANLSDESKPLSLSRDGLDKDLIEKEREVLLAAAKNDPKNEKKPEEILKKIIEGQINKFVAARCLLEQPYARDPKLSIEKYVQGSGAGVTIENYAYVATDVE